MILAGPPVEGLTLSVLGPWVAGPRQPFPSTGAQELVNNCVPSLLFSNVPQSAFAEAMGVKGTVFPLLVYREGRDSVET